MSDRPIKTAPECPFQKRFPSQLNKNDHFYMALAYNLAIEAWNANEVPIGAVIELNGEVIGKGYNQVESASDATAHAEMIAITQACASINDWRLNEATLYVTKEPCPMCSGASVMSRVGKVVFAFSDPKMGGLGGAYNLNDFPRMNHTVTLVEGVMEEECKELIQTFFKLKRNLNNQ